MIFFAATRLVKERVPKSCFDEINNIWRVYERRFGALGKLCVTATRLVQERVLEAWMNLFLKPTVKFLRLNQE